MGIQRITIEKILIINIIAEYKIKRGVSTVIIWGRDYLITVRILCTNILISNFKI